ncbi:MAG: hypothetical protein ACRD0Y_01635 [Terriglobales bacterium]
MWNRPSTQSDFMSMYGFFPWLRLTENLTFGEFELQPFSTGDTTAEAWGGFAKVLTAYKRGASPVSKATRVRFHALAWNAELDESQRSALFEFSDLLAASGIAARELFEGHTYQNRDNFLLVVQSCNTGGSGVTITTRRRDGSTTAFLSIERYAVEKPDHVHLGLNRIDGGLLTAMLDLRTHCDYVSVHEAITLFNLANTDRPLIREYVEVVLAVSALERLLGCSRGREDELAPAFTEILKPSTTIPTADSAIVAGKGGLASYAAVREAWVRDFFRLRGSAAHGRLSGGYTPAWSTESHLLLASFVFPLVLKRKLEADGLYCMSKADLEMIDRFEMLLCEDLFLQAGEEWPWHRISSASKRNRRVALAATELHRKRAERGPVSAEPPQWVRLGCSGRRGGFLTQCRLTGTQRRAAVQT